jgi:hypothetical protein
VTAAPLIPAPVYGIRAWTVTGEGGRERLAGTQRGAAWPAGGDWLDATCSAVPAHAAPASGCACGIHAWHPGVHSARRVLAGRAEVPGVVEARGAIEVHDAGFRAQSGRPHALFLMPGRNAARIHRLAAAYGVEVVEVDGPDALLRWCHARGRGLEAPVVAELLGPEALDAARRARRTRASAAAARLTASVAIAGVLVIAGLQLLPDPPGPRVLHGRTGEIHTR